MLILKFSRVAGGAQIDPGPCGRAGLRLPGRETRVADILLEALEAVLKRAEEIDRPRRASLPAADKLDNFQAIPVVHCRCVPL